MPSIRHPTQLYPFSFKDNYVQRDKTNAPYQTAHPDNTLIYAGFARYASNGATSDQVNSLRFIGACSSVSVNETQQVQPLKELGSSRYIMTSSNAPVSVQLTGLVVNAPNLLKSLYSAARGQAGTLGFGIFSQLTGFSQLSDDKSILSNGWCNLDYPIFQVPFGIGIISRTVGGAEVMGVYAEVCLVQNWTWTSAAGQTAIFSNCSIIADRVIPFQFDGVSTGDLGGNTTAADEMDGFTHDGKIDDDLGTPETNASSQANNNPLT